MNFPKSVTIEACEAFLSELNYQKSDEPLILPVGASSYAFGGLASAIQAVNTWARTSEDRAIKLRPSKTKNEIAKVIESPYKFAAAMSARSIVNTGKNEADLRRDVNICAKASIEQQATSKYGQQRGGLCWFAFVDHSSKGFDRNFYIEKLDRKPVLRQPAQFQAVVNAMVGKSMAVPGGAKPLNHETLEHLGRLFYELFLNSHEHGTRSHLRSEWLKPGVRVICTQGHNLSEKGAMGIAKQKPILSAYLKSVTAMQGTSNKNRFVEISIVDSGLGYCDRWQADHLTVGDQQNISIEEEYAIFKRCFTFRQTSTTEHNKGHGLAAVMDRLTRLEGFMLVRSGRLALYRDFVASPYMHDDACEFLDWVTGTSAETTQTLMTSAAGVAISLIIPLEAKSE